MQFNGGNRVIVAASSYGNDSCALIQWLHENGFPNVVILYNNTGWSVSWWPARVERMERWARSLGYHPFQLTSIGMEQLVRDHRGWPRQGMQFCTEDLKITPTLQWLAQNDPEFSAVCATGVRREESDRRKDVEEWQFDDPRTGGRDAWRPLAYHTEQQRNALLERAGIKPLPGRSRECDPCINSGRRDLRELKEPEIIRLERMEKELGFSGTGKPRVMFRPARKMGAVGIREVLKWAKAEPGKFGKGNVNIDDEPAGDCDDLGYCGS